MLGSTVTAVQKKRADLIFDDAVGINVSASLDEVPLNALLLVPLEVFLVLSASMS